MFRLEILLVIALLLFARSANAGDVSAERGESLIARKGCGACHSTDGSARQGPTFRGLFGAKRTVTTGGASREVTADRDYLTRAMRDPDADVVAGFPRGTMPKYPLVDDEIASITLAIEKLAAPAAEPAHRGSTTPLFVSAAAFTGLHLLLSSIPVRRRLIAALSQRGFAGVYSLLVAAAFAGMIFGYVKAPYVEVWLPPRGMRWMPLLVMPFAILLMVAGFSTRGPTTVGGEALASQESASLGVFSITRHPALWGFALWGMSHTLANGELRAVVLFLAVLTLALVGMVHIDRRRAAELGEAWTKYQERTSLVPFAAIMGGRAELDLRGIGWARFAAAIVIYVGVLHTHHLVIGASPLP
ncbi:MAG: c-type cytochrome [Labilithrix sp.]|nr:c-type cytochrome [Labilithrix sp.]